MGSMDSPDLQGKYQKLATEYSKLKAQNQVLKKAVIEEQGKNSQLKENLKTQDQTVRKSEQELDSLTFRNQQLTKRLALLQEDLESIKKNKNKKNVPKNESSPSQTKSEEQLVYIEELQSKIKENARLHAELSDLERFYTTKISEMESLLSDSKRNGPIAVEEIATREAHLQAEIKRLENELIVHEVRSQQKESKISSLQEQLGHLTNSQGSQFLTLSNEVQGRREGFSSLEELSSGSSSTKPESERSVLTPLLGSDLKSFMNPIRELCKGFVQFFTSFCSLLKESSTTLSSNQIQLTDQLPDELECWNVLSKRYEELCLGLDDQLPARLESLSGLDVFSKAFAACAASLRKLLPLLSERWLCSQEGHLNGPWRSTVGRLVSSWSALNPYVTSLAACSEGRTNLTPGAILKIFNILNEKIIKLRLTAKELVAAWDILCGENNKKAENTQKALSAIETSLNEICGLLNKNLPSVEGSLSSPVVSSSPSASLPQTPSSGVHNHSNTCSRENVRGCPDSGGAHAYEDLSMGQQLAQATSRLSQVEEEKEHWRLEHQLLAHRFDKEIEKARVRINCDVTDRESDSQTKTDSTFQVGETSVANPDSEEREREIRNHFTNRCSHLYKQLTSTTSQAALYQDECETLIRRLALCEESRTKSESETEKERKQAALIQENLTTTSRNYEEQISTMSDYLADLNEKISRQADQIEQLKFELKRKGKK